MTNKFTKLFLIVLSFFLIFSFNKTDAQMRSIDLNEIKNSLEITITPASPGANKDVFVKLESFSFDLNSSEIILALDGVIKSKGIGKKSFSFKTGKIGSVSLIKAIIKTKDGRNIEKSLVVRPAGVDILWEANSYTPPFYKGKALYSYQSFITVIALPDMIDANGVKMKPENMTYKWTKDSKVLGDVSGYGKNSFTFSKSVISHSPEIKVEVMSPDKKIKASGEITLGAIEPKTLFYENNPLYGIIYEKAIIGDFKLNGNEITLAPVPYFFSIEDADNDKIQYNWNMNGKNINSKDGEKQKTFRNTEGKKGSAAISLDLQNDSKVLQGARTNVLLKFEGGESDKDVSF